MEILRQYQPVTSTRVVTRTKRKCVSNLHPVLTHERLERLVLFGEGVHVLGRRPTVGLQQHGVPHAH